MVLWLVGCSVGLGFRSGSMDGASKWITHSQSLKNVMGIFIDIWELELGFGFWNQSDLYVRISLTDCDNGMECNGRDPIDFIAASFYIYFLLCYDSLNES